MWHLFPRRKRVNLVLGGGGVKGVALAGAVAALEKKGFEFDCIAGCSVGAVVGALKAAGMKNDDLRTAINHLELSNFWDNPLAERLGPVAKGMAVITGHGVHSGARLHEWLETTLKDLGVETFGDLKMADHWRYRRGYGYKLVVIAADLAHGELVRLPWDYPKMGLDPDKQRVADALRAATAIPFFYRPHEMGEHLLVDGGLISNYPLNIFNALDFQFSDRETIGVQLSLKPEIEEMAKAGFNSPLNIAKALVLTAMNAQNEASLTDPRVRRNTVYVDTGDVKITDFGITKGQQEQLYENGFAAAEKFARRW